MSDGGLKAGDVFVAFSASLSEFTRSMDQFLEDIEEGVDQVAKAMGEAAGAIGDFSDGLLSVAAAAGAAVAGAAEYSEDAKRANDELKNSVLQLSAEVGSTFLPLVRELNQGVRTLTATWRGLSSETKAQIVEAVRYAAVVGVAGKATSMSIGWAKSLAEGTVLATQAMRKMGPAVANGFSALAKDAGRANAALNALGAVQVPGLTALRATTASAAASLRANVIAMATAARTGLASAVQSVVAGLSAMTSASRASLAAVAAQGGVVKATASGVRGALVSAATGVRTALANMAGSIRGGFAAIARGATAAQVAVLAFIRTPFKQHLLALGAALRSVGVSLMAVPGKIGGFFAALRAGLATMATAMGPVLAIAAAVAGLVLLAGTLYRAFNDASTGLRDSVMGIIDSIRGLAKSVTDTLSSMFDSFMDFVLGLAESFLEVLASKVRAVAKYAEDIARRLNKFDWADNLAQVQNLTGSGMVKAVKEQVAGVVDTARAKLEKAGESLKAVGKEAGEAIGYGLSYSTQGVKDILKDTGLSELPAKLQGMLGGFKLGDGSSVEQGATLADKDNAYAEWLKGLEAPLQTLAYETAAEAKRALEAEARANEETLRAIEEAAATELEMAQANAEAAAEAAEEAHRARVEELYAASEMSAELADMARQLAEETQQRMEEARQALTSKLTSAFSSVTSIVDSFAQGMAASGGNPLIGLLSSLMDILMRSEGFQVLVEMVNTIVQDLANALDALLVPLQPLLGAVAMVTQALGEALAPALGMLGELLAPIVPVVALVGVILEALAPVFEIVTRLLSALLEPLKVLAEVVLKVLFEFLKGLAYAVLMVVKGLADVWNGILGAVQSVFRTLSEINIFGGKPLEFLGRWADGLEHAMVPVDGLTESMAALNQATWDGTRARAEETAAAVRNREALQEATEALTNVPPAWRAARAKYLAQDAQGPGGGGGMGPAVPGSAGAPGSSGPERPTVVVHQNITTFSPEETGRIVRRRLDDIAFRQTGGRPGLYGGMP